MPLSTNATYQLNFEDCEKAAFPWILPYLYIIFVYFIFPLQYLLTGVFFLNFYIKCIHSKDSYPRLWTRDCRVVAESNSLSSTIVFVSKYFIFKN